MADEKKTITLLAHKVSSSDAYDYVRAKLDSIGAKDVQLFPLDSEYLVVSEKDMMTVVRATHTNAMKYTPNVLDCDKFARTLWADIPVHFHLNSVAMILDFSGKHSYSGILINEAPDAQTPKLGWRWVEPQADEEIKIHSEDCYALTRGIVLL